MSRAFSKWIIFRCVSFLRLFLKAIRSQKTIKRLRAISTSGAVRFFKFEMQLRHLVQLQLLNLKNRLLGLDETFQNLFFHQSHIVELLLCGKVTSKAHRDSLHVWELDLWPSLSLSPPFARCLGVCV